MTFNGVLVVAVAKVSAGVWQQLACLSERIGGEELLNLVICFPLQQLGWWAIRLWDYLCVSPYPHASRYYSASDSDHDYSDDDSDHGGGGGGDGLFSVDSNSRQQYYDYYYGSQRHREDYDSFSNSD